MGTDCLAQLEEMHKASAQHLRAETERRIRNARWKASALFPLQAISREGRLIGMVPSAATTHQVGQIEWLAGILGICTRSAYDAVRAGEIPPDCYFYLGRRLRIRTHQVLAWVTVGKPGFDDRKYREAVEVSDEG